MSRQPSTSRRAPASQECGTAVGPNATVGGSVDRSKVGLFGMWLGVTPLGGSKQSLLQSLHDLDPPRVRFHLLSTFPFQELDQVALASHRRRSADVHRALSPFEARGSWGTSCARHGAAYTVWRARAVDGSYGGDVHASRGRTSLCTVVRVPQGWARRRRPSARRAHGDHRLAA